ncbi:MAG: MBL fold metallo-hydrolase [Fibrobacterota bacterium]|nr:MAG: MBL fold metallo-hydrolase [Fibrobacterota bacterium]
MSIQIRFLGTGGSFGIPIVGCDCVACQSSDPMDNRLRSSVLLSWGDRTVLVDAGPDLRAQALREGVRRLDEVWLTHSHADHTNGIDDLRVFCHELGKPRALLIRGNRPTLADAIARFSYAFRSEVDPSGVSHPLLVPIEIDGPFQTLDRQIVPIPVYHGKLPCTGFRIGNLAYLTDVSTIPDSSYALLEGLDTLVLSALREEPHPTHLSFDESIAVARRIGARQTWFTHFAHRITHEQMLVRFPDGIRPAWDGLRLEIPE